MQEREHNRGRKRKKPVEAQTQKITEVRLTRDRDDIKQRKRKGTKEEP